MVPQLRLIDASVIRITWVAKSRMVTCKSSSKAVHVATCMVLQLKLINASVISFCLIVYRRVQQIAVELHADEQQLGEGSGE
jgi:hypothetical protein